MEGQRKGFTLIELIIAILIIEIALFAMLKYLRMEQKTVKRERIRMVLSQEIANNFRLMDISGEYQKPIPEKKIDGLRIRFEKQAVQIKRGLFRVKITAVVIEEDVKEIGERTFFEKRLYTD